MSKPKDQPEIAGEAGKANAPKRPGQQRVTPENETEDEQPVDGDGGDDADDDEEIAPPGETRAPELPDETLADRD